MERRQHHVAREGGLEGDLGRLAVADLAHHDDVGVLAQDGAQSAGKGDAGALLDLHLVDPGHLVLDGILDGDDVGVGAMDLAQDGVQGRGLARARGAGDQDEALAARGGLHQGHPVALHQAQLLEREHALADVEQADDDLLAVEGGHGRHARVDVASLHGDVDAAVLWPAALGDVERGQHLHTAEERSLEVLGQGQDLVQQAVDAEPNVDPMGPGLDVDVGGTRPHGVVEHHVDNIDGVGAVAAWFRRDEQRVAALVGRRHRLELDPLPLLGGGALPALVVVTGDLVDGGLGDDLDELRCGT